MSNNADRTSDRMSNNADRSSDRNSHRTSQQPGHASYEIPANARLFHHWSGCRALAEPGGMVARQGAGEWGEREGEDEKERQEEPCHRVLKDGAVSGE